MCNVSITWTPQRRYNQSVGVVRNTKTLSMINSLWQSTDTTLQEKGQVLFWPAVKLLTELTFNP